MAAERLHPSQIEGLLSPLPAGVRSLALDARTLVLEIAPGLSERIAFHSLCYYKPDVPYGAIGGNVCLVSAKDEQLEVAFLHGASLPDPEGLLRGAGKAKRRMAIETREDLRRPALAALIRAAIAYEPSP